ncbi:putative rane transport protein [Salmonella enterica subsp. enterica serovar Typhimurium]
MLSIVVDKTYSPGVIMAALIVIHNFAVLGLFALENITMAEIFGSRNRFTRMAISKEAGGLVAVGFGPVLAGIFCNMTDSWLPILIMLVLYSCIGLISALLMPEVRDRDLSLPEDAAEATAARSYATPQPRRVKSCRRYGRNANAVSAMLSGHFCLISVNPNAPGQALLCDCSAFRI